jgi:hypothetical protein
MLETKKFDNEQRTRYYGLRVGDLVTANGLGNVREEGAEVTGYGAMDNNRVRLRLKSGTETDWVAEWCIVTTKVEDRHLAKVPG